MDTNYNELCKMPHNQMRKAYYIKQCIKQFNMLCFRYPCFKYDKQIADWLDDMRAEYDYIIKSIEEDDSIDEITKNAFRQYLIAR